MKRIMPLLPFIALFIPLLHSQDQKLARIGDFKLASGEVIRDCVIGYRTFGALNSRKNNAVVLPTYFGGTSEDLAAFIGPGKIVDSSVYYVIAVDALADGVSSSPSNSKSQPRMQFPQVTIRDMVSAEHKMLADSLHLSHVHAIAGISMGGLQAFQWSVSYPDFMDRIVSIEGSPQDTSWDVLLWRTELLAVQEDPGWKNGQYAAPPKLQAFTNFFTLVFTTPEYTVSKKPIAAVEQSFANPEWPLDANDTVRQIQALLSQNIAAPFGGSLQRAAATVRAPVLAIVNRQDHVVNPTTTIQLLKMVKGKLVVLDSDCGHIAFHCESARIAQEVSEFLRQ